MTDNATPSRHYGRDLRHLGAGAGFNGLGMSAEQVVVGLLMFQLGGSSTWVGISLALYFAPMFFCGPAAGALADRMDRRRLLAIVEVLQAAVLAVTATVIASGGGSVGVLLLLTLISGTVRTFHHPAKLGYAFDLSGPDQVVATLGRLNVVTRLGQLVGGATAGWVSGRVGPEAAIYMVSIGHLAGAGLLASLRTPGRPREARNESVLETLREYLRELRSNRELRLLLAVVCVAEIFGYAYVALLPELATVRLGLGAEGLGVLHSLRGLGGLLSGLVLSRTVRQRRNGSKYLLTVFGFGLALLGLMNADSMLAVSLLVTAVAACAAAGDVFAQSIMQLCVPDRLRGRAMGVWVLAIGTGPLGHLQMGALAGAAGLTVAFGFNGAVLVLVAGGAWLGSSRLRGL